MLTRDMQMNLSDAPLAAKPEEPSATTSAGTGQVARCTLPYALSVPRNVKYLSSLERAGQCIVVIATARLEQAAGCDFRYLDCRGLELKPAPLTVHNHDDFGNFGGWAAPRSKP